MEREVTFRIVLETPPAGVDFGLQQGHGNDYETVQTQRSGSGDLRFVFSARAKEAKDGTPAFVGPFIQGPTHGRFVYLDIGTYAGQKETQWSRRLKVPLRDISRKTVEQVSDRGHVLETRVQGTGGDGGPTCGTVKPFAGWVVKVK